MPAVKQEEDYSTFNSSTMEKTAYFLLRAFQIIVGSILGLAGLIIFAALANIAVVGLLFAIADPIIGGILLLIIFGLMYVTGIITLKCGEMVDGDERTRKIQLLRRVGLRVAS